MLKNKNPSLAWSVGDICFYQESWTQNIISGIITNISGGIAAIRNGPGLPVSMDRPLDALFATEAAAAAAAEEERIARVRSYESGMYDAESIVRFAWSHPVAPCEEYTDQEAREAYRNRAKAVLGIDLP